MFKSLTRASSSYSAVYQDVNARVKYSPLEYVFRPGWKSTISAGVWTLVFCLVANVTVLAWAYTHDHGILQSGGSGGKSFTTGIGIFQGDCDRAGTILTVSHLAINIVSTLILAAGTACMQCLASPTREEIDAAHRKGMWFHIGLLSTRNLRGISWTRFVLYIILAISSVPIHFFYNAIIYSTLGTNDILTVVTTERFVTEGAINTTRLNALTDARGAFFPTWNYGNSSGYNIWLSLPITPPPYPSHDMFSQAVGQLKPQNNDPSLRNVSWSECIKEFTDKRPYEKRQSVAIVTSLPNSEGDILDLTITLPPGKVDWSCNPVNGTFKATNSFLGQCAIPLNGTMPAVQDAPSPSTQDWNVKYCLVKDSPGYCQITFAPSFITPVIIMNVIKLAVLLYTLFALDYKPLITAGDVIVSFMSNPDPCTEGVAAHSTQSVAASANVEGLRAKLLQRWYGDEGLGTKRAISLFGSKPERRLKKLGRLAKQHDELMHGHAWHQKQKRWSSAVSKWRWIVTLSPWIILILTTITYCIIARPNVDIGTTGDIKSKEGWSQPLGTVNPGFISRSLANNSLVQLVVLSNIPQFGISIMWILMTAVFTSMLIASEVCDYTKEAKGMRVSPPVMGAQRSTYFLQIPYRYWIPMTCAIIVLHWLTSQSLFLVRLSEFNIAGQLQNFAMQSTLGYNLQGIAAVTICCGLMTLAPIFLGLRRFPKGTPIIGYNSLALSIACHPSPVEPRDAAARPLKYGLIQTYDGYGTGKRRLGFSSGPVEPIEDGAEYDATRCLSKVLMPGEHSERSCTLEEPQALEETTSYEAYRKV